MLFYTKYIKFNQPLEIFRYVLGQYVNDVFVGEMSGAWLDEYVITSDVRLAGNFSQQELLPR